MTRISRSLRHRFSYSFQSGSEKCRIGCHRSLPNEPDSWGLGDKQAAFDNSDGSRQNETIHNNGGFVHYAIIIRIFKNHHTSNGLLLPIPADIQHVDSHLHDVEPTVLIPGDRYWVILEWFLSDELQSESGG
ncbi:hypothetical protein [Candidatus Pelagisphaera phototrophica]|uniref:hypothetical protein n=1 Tax=Candidatus Pelagisphaera phototrophica TaxID=2684113 RepID=UPI0019E779F1|nr:hypothetical protein [Candidatus Pelagisphaera phototrophica]QXD32112.1 hypothetical protein GA004_17750 [Candidatus Pelagisphaera phototrophica]